MSSWREKLRAEPSLQFHEGLFFHTNFTRQRTFEKNYLSIRAKEKRIYSDEQVRSLPDIDHHHPHASEWRVRKKSLKRLIQYMNKRPGEKSILEIGCGNGWLSHNLARRLSAEVVGIDVNEYELSQGSRVFVDQENLNFIYGDILTLPLSFRFDFIILASSVQYFSDVTHLVETLLEKINPQGEIHVLDSPIYSNATVHDARQRSLEYFQKLQGEMATHYFHHSWYMFDPFDYKILNDPQALLNRIAKKLTGEITFPWIVIRK